MGHYNGFAQTQVDLQSLWTAGADPPEHHADNNEPHTLFGPLGPVGTGD
jgi:hypothetical protein